MVGKKNKKKIPNPLKIHLDQFFSLLRFAAFFFLLFFFHQLQNAPMYRRNAQVWSTKGESYIFPQRPGFGSAVDIQLILKETKKKQGQRESTNHNSSPFELQYKGTNFLTVYSFYLSFIAFSFYSRVIKKDKSRLYKANIQAVSR